jgi:predicted transcriptional regulator
MAVGLPTERELDALKILWKQGLLTVREIWEILRRRDTHLAYTSVLSLLQSMEEKQLVGHQQAGRAYRYYALIEREPTFRGLATRFMETVFDGATTEYVLHALEGRALSRSELEELEQLIVKAKRRSKRNQRGGAT